MALSSGNNHDSQEVVATNNGRLHLVLVGGGHAHVQVIRGMMLSNPNDKLFDFDVTLVDPQTHACYSGMVPGCIADLYTPEETMIDLAAMMEYTNKNEADHRRREFLAEAVVDVDLDARVLYTKAVATNDDEKDTGRSVDVDNSHDRAIPFDCLSWDVGSSSRDYHTLPGAMEYAIPTRPIARLMHRLESARQAAAVKAKDAKSVPHICVVGGGVAGLELGLAVTSRWRDTVHPDTRCTLITPSSSVSVLQENDGVTDLLTGDKTGVYVRPNSKVVAVGQQHVEVVDVSAATTDEEHSKQENRGLEILECTHCLWATGAGPHPQLTQQLRRRGQLDLTSDGWIRVSSQLQSTSHPFIFAAGDCAHIEVLKTTVSASAAKSTPVPKAGVYAVRAGPVLMENLTRYLQQVGRQKIERKFVPSPLMEYEPQDDFLKLIVCSHRGEAMGLRFGLSFSGPWVFRLKDAIDRKFLELFDVCAWNDHDGDNPNYLQNSSNTKASMAQYDATADLTRTAVTPVAAADLLHRTDTSVDHEMAWKILRTMTTDLEYRQQVIAEYHAYDLNLIRTVY